MNNYSDRYSQQQKLSYAALVYLMIPLGAMSTDIYLPSLFQISLDFQVVRTLVQLTITTYILAVGLSQVIAGPISDAYGRKKLLLIALFIQLLAVISILTTTSIYVFIGARFIQGLGAGLMLVPARAILNDIFDGEQLKKQFNYCTISFALGPIVAPFIGGYLQHYFNWQANFIFTLAYIIIIILGLLSIYRETLIHFHPFSISHLWQNYYKILRNPVFVVGAILCGLMFGYGGLFNITGPFLIQEVMHHSAITYGHMALLIGIAWFIGNTANRFLFNIDKHTKTNIAFCLLPCGILLMLLLSVFGVFNLPTLIIPTCFCLLLSGFISPIYVGESIVIFTEMPASANACLFTIIWLIFSASTYIGTFLKVHTLTPLAIGYLGVCILSILTYFVYLRLLPPHPNPYS